MPNQQDHSLSREELHKELDLIQEVVKRMAQNSFQVKTWLIGVLMAMLAFTKDEVFGSADSTAGLALNGMLFLPIAFFWYLDGFFLRTERLYRNVYKWVIQYRPITNAYLYDLNTFKREVKGKETIIEIPSTWKVMISQTLLFFYLIPLLFVAALMTYNLWQL